MRRLASEPPTAHRHSRGDDTMPTAKPTSRPKHTPKHTRDMTEEEIEAWAAAEDTPEDLADSEPVWSGTFAEAMRREKAIRQRGRPRTASPKVRNQHLPVTLRARKVQGDRPRLANAHQRGARASEGVAIG